MSALRVRRCTYSGVDINASHESAVLICSGRRVNVQDTPGSLVANVYTERAKMSLPSPDYHDAADEVGHVRRSAPPR